MLRTNILKTIRTICFSQRNNCTKIGIVGAPFDKGQLKEGVDLAPTALRQTGLVTYLKGLGFDVQDYGDIQYKLIHENHSINNVPHMKNVIGFNKLLSERVTEVIKDGRMCLTLGGDHSVGVGTVHGHLKAQPNTSLLWVDAHADIHTTLTSDTGNVHGMPLSFHVEELAEYHPELPGFSWHSPMISAKNIAFIGLRDVEPIEKLIIEKLGICAMSMEEVHDVGLRESVRYALSKIDPENNRFIHVSFDIDALDPLEAPSTGTPVRGGLTLREGIDLLRTVRRTGRMSGVDIVEVNPRLGSENDAQITLDAARHLAAAAAGNYPGGKPPKDITDIPRPSKS